MIAMAASLNVLKNICPRFRSYVAAPVLRSFSVLKVERNLSAPALFEQFPLRFMRHLNSALSGISRCIIRARLLSVSLHDVSMMVQEPSFPDNSSFAVFFAPGILGSRGPSKEQSGGGFLHYLDPKSISSTRAQIAWPRVMWHSWIRAVIFEGACKMRSQQSSIAERPAPVQPNVRNPLA